VARRAVVVGGGLIGTELAEVLARRGVEVTMLVREAGIWEAVLPREEELVVREAMEQAGARVRTGEEVAAFLGEAGRVQAVRCHSGLVLEADLVGICIGVEAELGLARGAGLSLGRGILVDRSLRVAGTDIWAAGDCVEIAGEPGGTAGLWNDARAQGRVAGAAIAGEQASHRPGVPLVAARFGGLAVQVHGAPPTAPGCNAGARWADPRGPRSLRLVQREGRLVGLLAVGLALHHPTCARWIEQGLPWERVAAELAGAFWDDGSRPPRGWPGASP
jgi:NAD(P)H-nitrite reductase large subunit